MARSHKTSWYAYLAVIIVFASTGLVAYSQRQQEGPLSGNREVTLEHGGLTRRALVHVPPGYDPAKPTALVLAFHGGLGRADVMERQTNFDRVADKHNFIVAYPDGTGRARFLTFNAGHCCGYAVRQGIDDVGFTSALIDELSRQYKIDPNRVYATGFSNGAMLCHRLGVELSDKIAAIAPVSGSMAPGLQPSHPVPVMIVHGLGDRNVPFAGGVGENAVQPVPHPAGEQTIARWLRADGDRPQPETQEAADYQVRKYRPRDGRGSEVDVYLMKEGGHTWPGGIDVTPRLGTGKLVTSFDASEEIWQFFAKHPKSAAAAK
ncbi:MAG: PHB depolymerase family esterase [Pirellulales bacterium]